MKTPSAADPATSIAPTWRHFSKLCFAEAAFVMGCCPGDPWTMNVTCRPGVTNFAVASEEEEDRWKWAIVNAAGDRLDHGWERTFADAQRVALEAQTLWAHRCDSRQRCHCAGVKS